MTRSHLEKDVPGGGAFANLVVTENRTLVLRNGLVVCVLGACRVPRALGPTRRLTGLSAFRVVMRQ